MGVCKLSDVGCWDSNLGPLQEHLWSSMLTSSLQPLMANQRPDPPCLANLPHFFECLSLIFTKAPHEDLRGPCNPSEPYCHGPGVA